MKLEHFIAFRYIKYSNNNKEISSSAKTVILSIAVAVIFYISAVSIMNGYIYGIMQLVLEVKSFHVQYRENPTSKNIFLSDDSIPKTKRRSSSYSEMESQRDAFSENKLVKYSALFRETSGLLQFKGRGSTVSFLRELPEDIFEKDSGFQKMIRLQSGDKSLGFQEILISEKTASKLKVKVGDTLFLTFLEDDQSERVRIRQLRVSGTFSTGFIDLDEQLAFIGRETGERIFQELFPYRILIKLKDYQKTKEFCQDYPNLIFSQWEEENYNELTALKFQKNIIAFIVVLVIFVAVLNILSTVYITVFEKSKEIGILKSIGYLPRRVVTVFLFSGLYLALLGILLGIVLGLFVMLNLNPIINLVSVLLNQFLRILYQISCLVYASSPPVPIEFFSKDFYLDQIYTSIGFPELLFISGLTLCFSILASILPAMKAGYIKPNEVLKNE